MALTDTPLWMQAGTYPARVDRQLINEIWREGVLRGLVVGSLTTGFTATISAGAGVVQGDDQPAQGKYLVEVPANVTVPVDPPPGVGSRTDLIILRIIDPNAGGTGTSSGVVDVVRGTAGNPGAAPALPPSAIELARATVQAGDTFLNAFRISITNRMVGGLTGFNTAEPIYANEAALNAALPSAPDGNHAITTTPYRSWVRRSGAWIWDGPQGVLGYAERSADSGPLGCCTESTIFGMSFSVDIQANRRIRVAFQTSGFLTSGGGTLGVMRVRQDGTAIIETKFHTHDNTGYGAGVSGERIITPSAGTHTFALSFALTFTTLVVYILGASAGGFTSSPQTLLIEDLGHT